MSKPIARRLPSLCNTSNSPPVPQRLRVRIATSILRNLHLNTSQPSQQHPLKPPLCVSFATPTASICNPPLEQSLLIRPCYHPHLPLPENPLRPPPGDLLHRHSAFTIPPARLESSPSRHSALPSVSLSPSLVYRRLSHAPTTRGDVEGHLRLARFSVRQFIALT